MTLPRASLGATVEECEDAFLSSIALAAAQYRYDLHFVGLYRALNCLDILGLTRRLVRRGEAVEPDLFTAQLTACLAALQETHTYIRQTTRHHDDTLMTIDIALRQMKPQPPASATCGSSRRPRSTPCPPTRWPGVSPAPVAASATTACCGPPCFPWSPSAPSAGRRPSAREPCARRSARPGSKPGRPPDFRGWLSIHFIQNAGLHTQSLKLGSLAELAGKPRNVREGILATRELLPLAEARGVDLRRHRSDVLPFTAPVCLAAPVLTWLFGHFPPVRTVMDAHANPEELRAVCRDTLAEARRLGVPVPRLEAAEPYFAAEKH